MDVFDDLFTYYNAIRPKPLEGFPHPHNYGRFKDVPPRTLVALCIYGEANHDSKLYMYLIGCVIRNRVSTAVRTQYSGGYPERAWKDTVLRKGQFSCFNVEDLNYTPLSSPTEYNPWVRAKEVAFDVMFGAFPDLTLGATHYKKAPCAIPDMSDTINLNGRVFYRDVL